MKTLLILMVVCLSALARVVLASPASLPVEFTSALSQSGVPLESVAVFVQAVDATEPILLHQAQKAMNPASTMKLVTSYAGLELLSPAYRWKTEVYYDGTLVQGLLSGNLYIKGYGDPSLMVADFWRLLNAIRQAGVREITGDIVIDSSAFASAYKTSAAFDGDGVRAYNALPNASLINLNAVSFRFDADASNVNISIEPALPALKVRNQLKVGRADCAGWRNRLGYDVKRDGDTAVVTFSGVYPSDCKEKYMELIVFDNATYTGHLFKELWRQLGGSFNGATLQKTVPANASLFYSYESDAIAGILRDINKWSNNVMARQVLLTLGLKKGAPATEAKGAQVIKEWVQAKGWQFDELVIENGAGLSRKERISAAHMGQMLVGAYQSPVMPELMSSLPIIALDGTMKKRMVDSPIQGRAHLKTGSLTGVFALAGYVLANNGKRYALVLMVNHANAAGTKKAQDALLEWVYNNAQ